MKENIYNKISNTLNKIAKICREKSSLGIEKLNNNSLEDSFVVYNYEHYVSYAKKMAEHHQTTDKNLSAAFRELAQLFKEIVESGAKPPEDPLYSGNFYDKHAAQAENLAKYFLKEGDSMFPA